MTDTVELRRAIAAAALSSRLVDWLADAIARAALADDDADSVAVTALVGVATAFAAGRCVDARAAVALIHCVAEAAAADIYEPVV